MKINTLEKIIKNKQNKNEFAIVTNLSTGETELFKRNTTIAKNLEKYLNQIE